MLVVRVLALSQETISSHDRHDENDEENARDDDQSYQSPSNDDDGATYEHCD